MLRDIVSQKVVRRSCTMSRHRGFRGGGKAADRGRVDGIYRQDLNGDEVVVVEEED